jgi:excisionase family DNA binding protein
VSDAADRLARALRDLIDEAVQAAVDNAAHAVAVQAPPTPRRLLIGVVEARQELGGFSNTTFYGLVNTGELSTVKIGRRTFIAASELDAYVERHIAR